MPYKLLDVESIVETILIVELVKFADSMCTDISLHI